MEKKFNVGIKKSGYKITANDRKPSWSLIGNWNLALDKIERSPAKPRDYLWASQLGGSVLDAWLSLMGAEKSNDFDLRAKKKFDAGVFWEWIVILVSKRAGIYIDSQKWVEFQYKNLLKIGGYYDLKIGGKRDFEMANKVCEALKLIELPERFTEAMELISQKVDQNTELPVRILEVKSCSAFMFDAQYSRLVPSENHALQNFHYLKGTNIKEGAVLYISKDDCRMVEIPIWLDDEGLEEKYKNFLEQVTFFYNRKEKPPKEPEILFDYDKGKFTDNWNIKYSAFLTAEYGWEKEGEYEDAFKNKIVAWNRVLGKIIREEKITNSNKEIIEEIKTYFPNFEELIETAKKISPKTEEEEYANS